MKISEAIAFLQFRKFHFRWLVAADILTNLIPVVGLFFLDWRVFSVMLLYFSDMVVFFVLFLFWFVIASRTKVISKILNLILKLFLFTAFVITQAYFIFVFTGQYYFSRKSMGYQNIEQETIISWVSFFQEILAYMAVLLPKFIQEDVGLLVAMIIFLANHIFVLSSPDHEILLSGFGKFFSKIGFPTFAIIVIAIFNLIGLIGESLEIALLPKIAVWVTLFFILLNTYYDLKNLILSKRGKAEYIKRMAIPTPNIRGEAAGIDKNS